MEKIKYNRDLLNFYKNVFIKFLNKNIIIDKIIYIIFYKRKRGNSLKENRIKFKIENKVSGEKNANENNIFNKKYKDPREQLCSLGPNDLQDWSLF